MYTRCGLNCRECYAFSKECPGCEEVMGKPFWTEQMGGGSCLIYKCCVEKDYQNCGKCRDLPCKTWYELKDPSVSDKEHLDSIKERISSLRAKNQ